MLSFQRNDPTCIYVRNREKTLMTMCKTCSNWVFERGKGKIGSTESKKKPPSTSNFFLSFNLMIFALKSRVLSNNKRRETGPRMRLIQCIPDAKDTLNDFLCVIRFFLLLLLLLIFLLFHLVVIRGMLRVNFMA